VPSPAGGLLQQHFSKLEQKNQGICGNFRTKVFARTTLLQIVTVDNMKS
jgi:hypothetical protein